MPNSPESDHQPQAPASEPAPEAPPRDLDAELARMEDRFKRAAADLDNYRKRTTREIDRLVSERTDAMLVEWLEVVDGLDRALAQRPEGPLYEGLRALLEQVDSILERHGVTRIGKPGEPFDPTRHEAVDVRDVDDGEDRTVAAVVRSGFARGDRVLRPAQVVVTRARQPQA